MIFCGLYRTITVLGYCTMREQKSYRSPEDSEGVPITDLARVKTNLLLVLSNWDREEKASVGLITAWFH